MYQQPDLARTGVVADAMIALPTEEPIATVTSKLELGFVGMALRSIHQQVSRALECRA